MRCSHAAHHAGGTLLAVAFVAVVIVSRKRKRTAEEAAAELASKDKVDIEHSAPSIRRAMTSGKSIAIVSKQLQHVVGDIEASSPSSIRRSASGLSKSDIADDASDFFMLAPPNLPQTAMWGDNSSALRPHDPTAVEHANAHDLMPHRLSHRPAGSAQNSPAKPARPPRGG